MKGGIMPCGSMKKTGQEITQAVLKFIFIIITGIRNIPTSVNSKSQNIR